MQGVENLFERLGRMVAYGPIFCDITWGAGGSTADVTLDIAKRMQNQASLGQNRVRAWSQAVAKGSLALTTACPSIPVFRSASRL
jgi:hypothetical protein